MKTTTANNKVVSTFITKLLKCGVGIGSLVLASPLVAQAGDQLDKSIQISIDDNSSLEDSLIEWGNKAGMAVLMNTSVVAHRVTHGVQGTLSARKALELLLRDTGLTYTESGERIRVVPTESLTKSSLGRTAGEMVAATSSDFSMTSEPPSDSLNGNNADDDQSSNTLDQVVVTAERREESVNHVPISITALSQQTMNDLNVERFADLSNIVPGLYNLPTGGYGQDGYTVSIRGIFSNNNAPTTQFYIDETPIAIRQMTGAALSGSPQPLIFDLDHVEVLRGPQGTLFGASAMGGAIRFITPQPSVVDTSGFAKADFSYTEHGSPGFEVGAAYGAPIVNGSSGFRVSAWYQSIGGFIDQEDPFTGKIVKSNNNSPGAYVVRPALIVKPTESLSITPSVYLQHKDSQIPNSYWATDLPDTESDKHVWGGESQPLFDDLRVASLAIKYDLAGLALRSDTSYLNRDLRDDSDFDQVFEFIYGPSPTNYLDPAYSSFHSYAINVSNTNAWQQEFRLSSQDETARVNWVVGAFYRHAVEGLKQMITPDLTPLTELSQGETSLVALGFPNYVYQGMVLNAFQDFHATDISEAAFVDVTAKITSHLILNAGIRAEHSIVQDQNEVEAGPFDGLTYVSVTLPDQLQNPVTPRFSLTYQITDDDMVYTSAARGYRPGGGNPPVTSGFSSCEPSLKSYGLTSVQPSFSSDSLWSYEIGNKDLFFNNHLSVAASIFYIDWSNIQTNIGLPSCQSSFTANYSKATSQGFDLQIAALVTDHLKFGLNLGYTDAYYPKAFIGAPQSGSPGPGPTITAAGEKLPGIPWTAAANANYTFNLSDIWSESKGYFRVDYRWESKATSASPLDSDYDPTSTPFPTPTYGVLNLRLGVQHGGFDLSAYINNVANSDPVIGLAHLSESDPLFRASAIQPRTIGVTGWYRF